ncbi:MAG: hypothetical protein IJX12_08000 [Lachnospiraceae bacterium]|nr:hypothetical protein [Lachnospiraceae bacterium]
MNNTMKGKYELARKMLKGKIDVDEVVLMSGLSKEIVEQLKEEVDPSNPEIEMLKNLDNVDLNIGEILFDNLPAEDEMEGFTQ